MGDRDERAVRVSVGDVELATRQRGRGIPFLWGHGLMGSMAQEQALGLFLWQQVPARVIRFDARSHGESDLDLDPAHLRWPALARDMLALAKAAGAPRAVLGGVSMGCATSLHAALREPDRVAGLVLVAPPTAWETRPRQSRFYRVAATAVDWLGLAPIRLFAALPRFGPQSPVAALQTAVAESLAGANPRAVAAAMRGAADSDLPAPEAVRLIGAPALILAWRSDPVHPVSTARRLAELLPQAELQIAGTLEELRAWPERVARFVRELEGNEAEGSA